MCEGSCFLYVRTSYENGLPKQDPFVVPQVDVLVKGRIMFAVSVPLELVPPFLLLVASVSS
jgi:hypothetical protein